MRPRRRSGAAKATGRGRRRRRASWPGCLSPPTRALLDRVLPAPGEGPSEKARENGFFRIEVHARDDGGRALRRRGRGARATRATPPPRSCSARARWPGPRRRPAARPRRRADAGDRAGHGARRAAARGRAARTRSPRPDVRRAGSGCRPGARAARVESQAAARGLGLPRGGPGCRAGRNTRGGCSRRAATRACARQLVLRPRSGGTPGGPARLCWCCRARVRLPRVSSGRRAGRNARGGSGGARWLSEARAGSPVHGWPVAPGSGTVERAAQAAGHRVERAQLVPAPPHDLQPEIAQGVFTALLGEDGLAWVLARAPPAPYFTFPSNSPTVANSSQ